MQMWPKCHHDAEDEAITAERPVKRSDQTEAPVQNKPMTQSPKLGASCESKLLSCRGNVEIRVSELQKWNREQGVGGRETKIVNAQMKVLEPKWNRINKEDPCKTQRTSTLNVLQGLSFVDTKSRSRKRKKETNAKNDKRILFSQLTSSRFWSQKALPVFICWMVCLTVEPSLVRSCFNRTNWPDGTNNPNQKLSG